MEPSVIEAAIDWWRTKRPLNWSETLHLANPTVKLTTPTEKALALAVARHLIKKEV